MLLNYDQRQLALAVVLLICVSSMLPQFKNCLGFQDKLIHVIGQLDLQLCEICHQ